MDTPATSSFDLSRLLLAIGFALFLATQIGNLGQNSRSLDWQTSNLERQLAALTESETKLASIITQRDSLAQQSQQIQTRYTEMLGDLMTLSETDADAAAVVAKYKIQRQQPATPPQSPAAANTPANP